MSVKKAALQQSSSLILLAKTSFVPSHKTCNYKLLSIVRSAKSGFMPNTHVFPGGKICEADRTRDWLSLYEKFGFKEDSFRKLAPVGHNVAAILQNGTAEKLPPYLSLRIGAIRETFEECGILICRSFKTNYRERPAKWAPFVECPEIIQWQEKVHNGPEKFLQLCREFEIYPDVWALKEWSNWITPFTFHRRFDTIFYVACFHQTPAVFPEKHEVESVEWNTAEDFLRRSERREIALPPPQFYEISRVANFGDIDRLNKFAHDRDNCGLDSFLPVNLKVGDLFFSLLPGDDLYPEFSKKESGEVIEIDQLPDCQVTHRILQRSPFHYELQLKNYTPNYKHIAPKIVYKSKL